VFTRRIVRHIALGDEAKEMLRLQEWFQILKEDNKYMLVVMRRIGGWDQRFAISNAAQIEITAYQTNPCLGEHLVEEPSVSGIMW